MPRIEAAAAIVAKAAASDAAVYGINTGLRQTRLSKRISAQDTATLQRNLILSHCCGMGEPTHPPVVRLMMALKLLSLGRGASGVRPRDHPADRGVSRGWNCTAGARSGSVGASGDLAPLAHFTAAMMGEGEAFWRKSYAGRRSSGKEGADAACARAPRKGGADQRHAVLHRPCHCPRLAGRAACPLGPCHRRAFTDAAMASTTPFRPEIHALRGLPGRSRQQKR